MPTIGQLPPSAASTDEDELLISQGGLLRSITRAQFLADTQQAITVRPGSLLGGISTLPGAPGEIDVGAGLIVSHGVLSVVEQPAPSLNSLDASAALVRPAGTRVPQTLADLMADAVSPESFGAVGDGVTDDTAAFAAAIATLRPVRLGPRVYATSGQWTITNPAVLIGVPGQSVIRRIGQHNGGAWISVQGSSFRAAGIVFDANSLSGPEEYWAVLVTAGCLATRFTNCVFANASGATLGNGLTILASDPQTSHHIVEGCEAKNNAGHGIWLQAVDGARISGNYAHDNLGYGICADYNDPSLKQAIRLAMLCSNTCYNNARGISVGNFNETNTQPPVWGNANPDAISVIVNANVCYNNAEYGIAVSGRSIAVQGNLLSGNGSADNGGAGILANCSFSQVSGNTITGASQYGIDSGGSLSLLVSSNHISGAAVGINPGGSQQVIISANYLQDNGWAIMIYNVETDGNGTNFGLATSNLDVVDNVICISASSGGGIWLIDAPQAVLVARNNFFGLGSATVGQCLYAHTDSVIIEGNRWNNMQRMFANPIACEGLQTAVLPDIADEVMLSVVPAGVQSMQTQRQIAVSGQIGYVKILSGGQGYSHASIAISGSGIGATATAYLSNGVIIGVALTTPGSGYGSIGATAVVTITGDGSGAQATASVGLPVIEGRHIRLCCNTATRFSREGSSPFQDNWTLTDITVPANATIGFTGTFGGWRADGVPLADYIAPPGDGSLIIRSMPGSDISVRAAGSGRFRITTDGDPLGYVAAVGHGAPTGIVTAPPGSDYRNLDGGVGKSFWVKQTGDGAEGWVAIA